MIYTITFNPSLDYIVHTNTFHIGKTNRCDSEQLQFGGKGINVSYVLNQLGVKNTALGFIAGVTGDALEKATKSAGISSDFIRLADGETRINVKIKGKQETEINGAGPNIDSSSLNTLFKKLDSLKDGDILVLSGSVPSGMPKDIYEQIICKLQNKKIRFVVDASKELLIGCLKYKPFLIKPNLDELQEICGQTLCSQEKIISAAKELKDKGALNVLVSLGEDGALLLDENSKLTYTKAHKINAINTVGAGDSMVAGFLAGLDTGYDYALRLANSAGAATAASIKLATRQEILSYLK